LRREFRPDLTVVFLNHLAHLQHQFWLKGDAIHPEMRLGLELSNAMMGLLLADRGTDEALLLTNGLKQKNVAGEGFHVYRQRNPQSAIEAMGVVGGRVEQCMSHDAHILFDDPANADRAFEILDRCMLSDGHKAFYVERQDAHHVFYQLTFEHKVAPGTSIVSGNYAQPFDAEFELICERTGAHVPEGDIFADNVTVTDGIKNHQIYDVVVDYFRQRTPAMAAAE
jgi:hypothetical protein